LSQWFERSSGSARLSEPLCDNSQQTGYLMRLLSNVLINVMGMALAGTLVFAQPVSSAVPNAAATLALVGGTVVDVSNWGDSAKDLPGAIVVVHDGRIIEVGLPGSVSIPKGAQVIDCTGKFLIPGLVDGFAGMNSQGAASANLYMGVTTVVARSDSQRGRIDSAAHPRPHLYLVDSIGTTDNWSLLAHRPEWAAKLREGPHPVELSLGDTARQLEATEHQGTRVLLLGHNLTAANTQWIITHAHQMGLVTYGEFVATPYKVGVEAGVDALVHMGNYELGVIPAELQQPLAQAPEGAAASTAFDYALHLPTTDMHLRTYTRFLASHHAALMPTFSLNYLELPGHRNLWKEPAASLLDSSRILNPADRSTGEMNYPLPNWARHLPASGQRWEEESLRKKAGQDAMRTTWPDRAQTPTAPCPAFPCTPSLRCWSASASLRAKLWQPPPTTTRSSSDGMSWARLLPAAAPTSSSSMAIPPPASGTPAASPASSSKATSSTATACCTSENRVLPRSLLGTHPHHASWRRIRRIHSARRDFGPSALSSNSLS
jgi:hypothetical protein